MLVQILQIRLVWSKIAYGKLNFHGNVVFVRRFEICANIAPHQSARVIIQRGTRYVEFCFFVRPLDFRFGPFGFFRFSIQHSIWFRIQLRKMWKLGIDDVSIASRQSLRTVWGTLVCCIRGVNQSLWTHVTLLGLTRTPNSCRSAPLGFLHFCNRQTNSIKTL